MENYSKLIIDGESMIKGKKFTYDIKAKTFNFESVLKNFDMDVLKSFSPKLNNENDFILKR